MKLSEKIIRIERVCEKLGGISKTTLWRWRRSGIFPSPRVIHGTSIRGWSESTVDEWIEKNFPSNQG